MSVARKDVAPAWTRSFPISKQPETIGEQLRKKRFDLGIRQAEAARQLGVSQLTLSLWERDKVYPTWAYQPRLIEYLDCDPFTDPALGRPKGNETSGVAFLAPTGPLSLGQQIRKRRLELRKNRKESAEELGVSEKTLWGWETGRCEPDSIHRPLVKEFLTGA
ncbi:MAG: helix-turn-helix domain-containing protein [Limisphaerales bacterium]